MNKSKIIFLLSFTLCVGSLAAKGKNKPVYVFGISTSFTDTITYRTDIQLLDSVYLDANKFLPARDIYAYQLKNYLEVDKGLKDRTCMIFFNNDEKKLTKEQNKLLIRLKKKNAIVQLIDSTDFKFTKQEE